MAEKQNHGIHNQKRIQQCVANVVFPADRGHGHDGLSSAPSLARASCLTRCGAQAGLSFGLQCFLRGIVPGGRAPATCAAASLLRKRARRYRISALLL
jgi:hypothetical protein